MDIRNTKAWKSAEWSYDVLSTEIMVPFMGKIISPEKKTERLESILKNCPQFYPAFLDLAFQDLVADGNGAAENRFKKGFNLMLEALNHEGIEEEFGIVIDNLENLWRYDLSEYCLKILIQHYPDNSSFYDALAHATARLGNVDGALVLIEKSVNIEPDNHYFRSNQGWIHLMAGNLTKAGEILESALQLKPDDEIVKNNLEIYKYLTNHGGNYFDYLHRPVEKEKIEDMGDEDRWDELDIMAASYNLCRFEAMAQYFLQEKRYQMSCVPDMLTTLDNFFNFVHSCDQGLHLNEDAGFLKVNFKPIMHKFIFNFGDVDQKMIEEIYSALLEYYDFLSCKGLVPLTAFEQFREEILGMKKELIGKMEKYNAIRHREDMGEDEKEGIREELFDGDHDWPFI